MMKTKSEIGDIEIRERGAGLNDSDRAAGTVTEWFVRVKEGDDRFAWQSVAAVTVSDDGKYVRLTSQHPNSSDPVYNLIYMKGMAQVFPAAIAYYEKQLQTLAIDSENDMEKGVQF